ncbi:thioredoxin family protein [Roseateles sp. DC23W]|uniref:Thioredoxin family protein n=1 Tax=Pelomonas dachongensis TaxID=3299029 RepID=A0ABW7ESJ0_9BURK
MTATPQYSSQEPSRADVDAMRGPTVLEFGANWCSICQAAQPAIASALDAHRAGAPLQHLKIEDGRGRPLGRSYSVKLWPTLVVLQDGREVARVVRPGSAAEITDALARLDTAPAAPAAPSSDAEAMQR